MPFINVHFRYFYLHIGQLVSHFSFLLKVQLFIEDCGNIPCISIEDAVWLLFQRLKVISSLQELVSGLFSLRDGGAKAKDNSR